MKLILAAVLLLQACPAWARSVFAHFMVTNTASYTVQDWKNDFSAAQEAGIDAFALNIQAADGTNGLQLPNAFSAANSLSFKLFFSFDYGPGPWEEQDVYSLIQQYAGNTAYFHRGSQPLVSTFEGPGNANDWESIKATTGCFFIPDWSSLGANAAMQLGVADGLFNWAAWPTGTNNMNTFVDASYLQYLGGKPYMMPISPWFFTNLPGYGKNWMWRGDALWYDRWEELLSWPQDQVPEFVEIISWNDYGESHYIGPLNSKAFAAFSIGEGPYNYAENMPHDAWRLFLPYLIASYKNGKATITDEGLNIWYRLSPGAACGTGGTTGNTATQLQIESPPSAIAQDKVFFSALLGSPADVTVTVGGVNVDAAWVHTPTFGIGVYFGSVNYNGNRGPVEVTLTRNGAALLSQSGPAISNTCTEDTTNWNAWTGGTLAGNSISATPSHTVSQMNCSVGFSIGNFNDLCAYTCARGYCPIGACVCTQFAPLTLPEPTGKPGYPISGENADYSGLCSFACSYGYCPSSACGLTKVPLETPTVSPFTPPACTAGTSSNPTWAPLCEWTCKYGYCPINTCTCTAQGALLQPPEIIANRGQAYADLGPDDGLCQFVCSRTTCPTSTCLDSTPGSAEVIPWYQYNCNDPYLDSLQALSGADVWNHFQCSAAFEAAQALYENQLEHPKDFPAYWDFSGSIADFFHYTDPGFNCSKFDFSSGSTCTQPTTCSTNSTAGFVIINSIATIGKLLSAWDGSLTAANAIVTDQIGELVDAFGNVPSESPIGGLLDILSAGLSLLAGPAIGALLGAAESGLAAIAETAATVTDMSKGFYETLDNDNAAEYEISTANNLSTNAANIVMQWYDTVSAFNTQLFNNSQSSITKIYDYIDNGTFFNQKGGPNSTSLMAQIESALLPQLIVIAWTLGDSPVFIAENVTGTCGVPPPYFLDDSINACINGQPYYLGSVQGPAWTGYICTGLKCPPCTQPGCPNGFANPFSEPPGYDELDAKKWGGVTGDDMISASVLTYKYYSNTNGQSNSDEFNFKIMSTVTSNSTQNIFDLAGILRIPVCTSSEAWNNWHMGNETPNFPCN